MSKKMTRVQTATISVLMLLLVPSFSCFQPPLWWNHRAALASTSSTSTSSSSLVCSATPRNDVPIPPDPAADQPPKQLTLEQLASQLRNSEFRSIVVVNGAGVSTSAGVPDFRTPGTGLYSRLEELNLPYPEAVFELGYFRNNPKPFVEVAQSIWPGQDTGPKPTLAHSFVSLLDQRGLLKRVYTQNIDGLESLAGVSDEKLIECHGHFRSASCTSCSKKTTKTSTTTIDIHKCREVYMNGQVYQCPDCSSPVKPDIVFFGETLPDIFVDNVDGDMDDCDLLIVMGTSLLVDPVASIPKWVGPNVPRLLINRELVGAFLGGGGIQSKKRDVFLEGDCDDGVRELCKQVGKDWLSDLETIHSATTSTKRP